MDDLDSLLADLDSSLGFDGTPSEAGGFTPLMVDVGTSANAGGALRGRGQPSFGPPRGGARGQPSFGPPRGGARGQPSFGPVRGRGGPSFDPVRGRGVRGQPSFGPIRGRGGPSVGPGRDISSRAPPGGVLPGAERGGAGLGGMATHTPDGRKIVAKGPPCAHCNEMVIGRILNAMGKQWHPEHFVCSTCSQPFKDGKFVEHEGEPFCEAHYFQLFAPKCIRCEQPILSDVVRALDQTWCNNHFTCTGCGVNLVGRKFKEAGGEPYCGECIGQVKHELDAKIRNCARCKKPIIGEFLLLKGQPYHPEHYKCNMCGNDFTSGDCQAYEGQLFDQACFAKLMQDSCGGCHKPILGLSVTALGRVWHPEHFVCCYCYVPFRGKPYVVHEEKPYCQTDYDALYSVRCAKCDEPVGGGAIEVEGRMYHKTCFCCNTCEKPLKVGKKLKTYQGKPLCQSCYLALPKNVRKKVEYDGIQQRRAEAVRAKNAAKEYKQAAKDAKRQARS